MFLSNDAYFGFARDLLFDAPQKLRQHRRGAGGAMVAREHDDPFRSADTAVNPVVDPGFLSDRRDQEVAV